MTKDEVIDIIKDTGYGCFSTSEDNQPKNRPMMPFLDEEGNLLIGVLSHSRTIDQVKKNPLVEMCYIDRKMWYVRVTGKAKVSDDKDKKQLVFNGIPMIRQYFASIDDPNFTLIEVQTSKVEAMTPHQQKPDFFDDLKSE